MADRYPLIYNPSANQIQELQSGDSLDVGNSAIKGATGYATTTGTSSQFLKADGSLDSSTYLTATGTAQLAQGLTGTPTIDVGDVTGVNATFSGNLTVNGTTTTLDTNLTEVDKLEIAANNNNVAVAITQSGAGKAMTVEGGDVGIGTNNPVERLHVAKNSATGPSFYITNDSTGHTNADGLQIGFDGSNNAQIRNRENTELKLYTNNTPRLTVTNNGFVGIGTDNPDKNLVVKYGAGNFVSEFHNTNNNTSHNGVFVKTESSSGATIPLTVISGTETRFCVKGDGKVGIGSAIPQHVLQLANYDTSAYVSVLANTSSANAGILFGDKDNDDDSYILHSNDDQSLRMGTTHSGTTSEKLRITSAGLVGIGVTNPTESLQVEGNLRMGSTADAPDFTNTGSKHITIGSAADALLVTHSSGQGLGYFGYEAGGDRLVVACDGGSGSNKIDFITDAGTTSGGSTDNLNGKVPKMRITAAGNIGINSTSPSGKLDIGGNVFPAADNTHDLGSASKRWANIYTGDLNLSNEGSANDVDGTWGQFTIQEGEDDLFLINRRTGKKYKFNLTEVD